MYTDIQIEFERECLTCRGSSRWANEPCATCDNTGHVPTELGDKLLEFLERRGLVLKAASETERT